ncbi:MAG: ABC transporter substrate-binding protein [Thermoprotei archaeon]|jgi:branched-chain amino acid transport system substrate-binding protein
MKRAISRFAVVGIIVVIIIIAVAAAVLLTTPSTTTTTTTLSTTTPAVKEIKVGVILPLSGSLAETGADLKRGIDFAVDEINSAGGIKNLGRAKLTIVYGDSAGDPSTGAREAERLITEEKVVALVGAYQSAVTKTASDVAESYNVPFLNPDSSSPTLTERGYQWFFRTTPHDRMFAEQHVEFINYLNKTYGGIKTIAIIHEDTEFGTSTKNVWNELFTAAGYNVVKIVSYHAATITSLDSEVAVLKAANPDVLLVASYTQDAILLVKTMKSQDFTPKVVLAQDAGFIDPSYKAQIGKDGYYIFSREVFNWDLGMKVSKLAEKNNAYKAKYGVDFDGNSARDYTGIYVLYYAIEEAAKKASPSDLKAFRTAIRDALRNINIPASDLIMPWAGVQFDSKGQNIKGRGIIVQMSPDDGKYHTVYPLDVATMNPIYPMPSWSKR